METVDLNLCGKQSVLKLDLDEFNEIKKNSKNQRIINPPKHFYNRYKIANNGKLLLSYSVKNNTYTFDREDKQRNYCIVPIKQLICKKLGISGLGEWKYRRKLSLSYNASIYENTNLIWVSVGYTKDRWGKDSVSSGFSCIFDEELELLSNDYLSNSDNLLPFYDRKTFSTFMEKFFSSFGDYVPPKNADSKIIFEPDNLEYDTESESLIIMKDIDDFVSLTKEEMAEVMEYKANSNLAMKNKMNIRVKGLEYGPSFSEYFCKIFFKDDSYIKMVIDNFFLSSSESNKKTLLKIGKRVLNKSKDTDRIAFYYRDIEQSIKSNHHYRKRNTYNNEVFIDSIQRS